MVKEVFIRVILPFLCGFVLCLMLYGGNRLNNITFKTYRLGEQKTNEMTVEQKSNVEDVRLCSSEFNTWYQNRTKRRVDDEEIKTFIEKNCNSKNTVSCAWKASTGPIKVNKDLPDMDWLYANELQFVRHGGWWSPTNCTNRNQTAVIIPFRNRYQHLPVLLRYLHPLLFGQNLAYRIFVIEQTDNYSFNRGKIRNAGFKEAMKFFPYSCIVFNDVDLVPEDDRIDYGCKHSPAHLAVGVDKFGYALPYSSLIGGVQMFAATHFENVNGFTNSFWKWGAEDDNLWYRVRDNDLKFYRQSIKIARYTMIKHKENGNFSKPAMSERMELLRQSRQYMTVDGLNSLQYDFVDSEEHPLFTLVKVNLRKDKDYLYKDMREKVRNKLYPKKKSVAEKRQLSAEKKEVTAKMKQKIIEIKRTIDKKKMYIEELRQKILEGKENNS